MGATKEGELWGRRVAFLLLSWFVTGGGQRAGQGLRVLEGRWEESRGTLGERGVMEGRGTQELGGHHKGGKGWATTRDKQGLKGLGEEEKQGSWWRKEAARGWRDAAWGGRKGEGTVRGCQGDAVGEGEHGLTREVRG